MANRFIFYIDLIIDGPLFGITIYLMGVLQVIEQIIEGNIFAANKVTFDLPVSTFVFMFLHLIFNAFVSTSGITVLAQYLQSQIPDNLNQVLAHAIYTVRQFNRKNMGLRYLTQRILKTF